MWLGNMGSLRLASFILKKIIRESHALGARRQLHAQLKPLQLSPLER